MAEVACILVSMEGLRVKRIAKLVLVITYWFVKLKALRNLPNRMLEERRRARSGRFAKDFHLRT